MSPTRLIPFLCAAILTVPAIAGQVGERKPGDGEVHVVCVGGARRGAVGKAEVKVDRPGKRVTLVLGSDSETAWEVAATKETSLNKVILIGMAKQTVGDLPKDVQHVEAFNDRTRRVLGIPAAYTPAFPFFRSMIQKLHAMTGVEVAGFHGFPRMPQAPIVVNAIQADAWLHSTYPTPEPAEGLPDLEFKALYFGVAGEGEWNAPLFTKFKLTKGPDLKSHVDLPRIRMPLGPIRRLVVDSETQKGYALSMGGVDEVLEIDLARKTTRKLPDYPRHPMGGRLNPKGIAFDVRRQRVLLSTTRNLFAYSPKTQQWDVVCEWSLAGHPGLAHDPLSDNLYVLGEGFGGNGNEKQFELSRYRATGERLEVVRLSGPLFSGVLAGESIDSPAQLMVVGDMLVLVSMLAQSISAPGPGFEVETFVYLINPKTGLTRLAWKEKTVKLMTQPRPAPPAGR